MPSEKSKSIWVIAAEKIRSGKKCILLTVVESIGSSPGRPGFKMLVSSDGSFTGSIGGGKLEFDLVEKAKQNLKNKKIAIELLRRIHSDCAPIDKSGMICSGTQFISIIPLDKNNYKTIKEISDSVNKNSPGRINLGPDGLFFEKNKTSSELYSFRKNRKEWKYSEYTGNKKIMYIVGGGHCSLALTKIMHDLDFHVVILDDRKDVSTMGLNKLANSKKIVNYELIDKFVLEGSNSYVVIMTFGHRADYLVLKKLINKDFAYLGMLGSERKVEEIFTKMRKDGFSDKQLKKVFAPIGLRIISQTPEEIAISIAAQIIKVYNSCKK